MDLEPECGELISEFYVVQTCSALQSRDWIWCKLRFFNNGKTLGLESALLTWTFMTPGACH